MSVYIHNETLGQEQWFFAGSKVSQVIDSAKTNAPPYNGGIIHQSSFVFTTLRCRIWGLFHGYGLLKVRS